MANIVGYTIVIGLCLIVLFAMFAVVRASMSDTEKHGFMKDIVDIMFSMQKSSGQAAEERKQAVIPDDAEPFEEECPACSAKVTHRDAECPSCGLRLQE